MILSYIRTLILYLMLIGVIRVMGKRQVGQMEPSEFVVTMLIANLAAVPAQNGGIPLYTGVVPILTVLALELCLNFLTMKSVPFRHLLCGKPVILIENGRLVQENLRSTRLTVDELLGQLRLKQVLQLETVQYAILETNGSLSVFLYPSQEPASAGDAGIGVADRFLPVTVVEDGVLFRENLHLAGKSESWVRGVLRQRGVNLADTMLLAVDRTDRVTFVEKELP